MAQPQGMNHHIYMTTTGPMIFFARYAHVTQFFWSMKLPLVALEIKKKYRENVLSFWHFLAFCLCVRLCAGIWLLEPRPSSCDHEDRDRRCQSGAWYCRATKLNPELPTNILANVNNCPPGLSLSWLGMECSLQKTPFPSVYSSVSLCVADLISSFWIALPLFSVKVFCLSQEEA